MEVTQQNKELRALKLALGLYVLIFAMKLAVYFQTGVIALFAEAFHTLSDIFISGFLLVALVWSRKAADEAHMFGHGRAQNVAALVAATLFISFTSYKLYEEAIPRLFKTQEASYQNLWVAVGILGASVLIAVIPIIGLFREKNRGAAAKAQLTKLFNDELGLFAALVGTMFIIWGHPVGDPIAAIVVATIIAVNAIRLFWENLNLLLGRSPGPEFLAKVESLARSVDGVLGVHDLRAEYIGPAVVHLGMHIEVERGLSIEEADRIANQVREKVHQQVSGQYCLIHVDAAGEAAW